MGGYGLDSDDSGEEGPAEGDEDEEGVEEVKKEEIDIDAIWVSFIYENLLLGESLKQKRSLLGQLKASCTQVDIDVPLLNKNLIIADFNAPARSENSRKYFVNIVRFLDIIALNTLFT